MEINSLADYGIIVLLLGLIFQFIIRPIMTSFLERRRNGGNNPCSHDEAQRRMLKVLEKCDDEDRPLVWGYRTEEAINAQTKLLGEFIKEIREDRTRHNQKGGQENE